MKKIILLFSVFCFANAFGQNTYTIWVNLNYHQRISFSNDSYEWSMSYVGSKNFIYNTGDIKVQKNDVSIANNDTFHETYKYNFSTPCQVGPGNLCYYSQQRDFTAGQLLANLSLGNLAGDYVIEKFTPNGMYIKNLNLANPPVCSGEMLSLAGYPSGFPKEAYHWQYSLDGQVTWNNVPAGFNDNDNNLSNFTMYDVLGDNHVNHFGTIYFRLGYDQNRPFTTPIAINYSPCAPVITKVDYLGPKCNGENIQNVTVTFDRPLDPTKNETLSDIYVVRADHTVSTPQLSQLPVNSFTPDKKYSFITLGQLEDTKQYEVRYQAQIANPNYVPNPTEIGKYLKRGFLTSPAIENFTYNEPKPLRFTTKENPAQCFGGLGSIEITAWGGSGNYSYELDGGPVTKFNTTTITTFLDTADNITKQKITIDVTTTTNPTNKNHSIRVTDDKDCFDKTAND
jgi:hypothetical protein